MTHLKVKTADYHSGRWNVHKCVRKVHLCHVFQAVCVCHMSCPVLVQEEKVAVAKAKDFLESNTYSADDPYTTALSAYALALLRSPYAPLALRRLNHMAITQGTATLITLNNMMSKSAEVHLFRAQ